jgi:hypothetical protein
MERRNLEPHQSFGYSCRAARLPFFTSGIYIFIVVEGETLAMDEIAKRMADVRALLVGLLFFAAAAVPVAAEQIEYQFHDSPRAEADVMVVRHRFRSGPGRDVYIVGRLFNRGLKQANNVRVIVTVTNREGAQIPMNPIYLNPSDIPGTTYADFEGRLLSVSDPRDVVVQLRAEWNR